MLKWALTMDCGRATSFGLMSGTTSFPLKTGYLGAFFKKRNIQFVEQSPSSSDYIYFMVKCVFLLLLDYIRAVTQFTIQLPSCCAVRRVSATQNKLHRAFQSVYQHFKDKKIMPPRIISPINPADAQMRNGTFWEHIFHACPVVFSPNINTCCFPVHIFPFNITQFFLLSHGIYQP